MAGLLEQGSTLDNQQIGQIKKGYQMAQQILFDKSVFDSMMQDIQQMDPVEGIAKSVVSILVKVQEGTGKMDLMSATALGLSILGELMDTMQQIGMPIDESMAEQAFGIAVQMYLSATAGQYSNEEITGAMEQVQAESGAQPAPANQGMQAAPGGV